MASTKLVNLRGPQGPPGSGGGGGGSVDTVNEVTPVEGNVTLTLDQVPDGTTNKKFTATEKAKLNGIDPGATANQSDATTNAAIGTKANDNAVVKLTGTQTVAGVKTFSSSPVVPAPTTDMQAATKKYVDDNAGADWGDIPGQPAVVAAGASAAAARSAIGAQKAIFTGTSLPSPGGYAAGDIFIVTGD